MVQSQLFGRLFRLAELAPAASAPARRSRFAAHGPIVARPSWRPRRDEGTARQILQHGFNLPRSDVDRLILSIQLYDLGLKDNELRQLVVDLIRRENPPPIRPQLKQLYRRYAPE